MGQQSCFALGVNMISFELRKRIKIKFKLYNLKNAMRRGVIFEISYVSALLSSIAKHNIFKNAAILIRATCGRGIVLTSGALKAFDLRCPGEITNMGVMLGLTPVKARAAQSYLPHNCISACIKKRDTIMKQVKFIRNFNKTIALGFV